MLATMARGDDCKTASKANYACKQYVVSAPIKKPVTTTTTFKTPQKPEEKKDYGAWGPVYKDKKTFSEMHFC